MAGCEQVQQRPDRAQRDARHPKPGGGAAPEPVGRSAADGPGKDLHARRLARGQLPRSPQQGA
jgi:hypothetical protein